MSTLGIWTWRAALAVLIVGVWQAISGRLVDSFWISRPTDIAVYLAGAVRSGQLAADLVMTFKATAYGYVGGALMGLMAGILLANSEAVAQVLRPFVLAVYGIPRIALAPIFILWFGIAISSRAMMAGMMTFMLVFFNTYEGVRACDPALYNVARVLGAGRWQLFWHVTLHNASPWIVAGLRIAIPQALVAAVVGEFIASTGGLGYRIMETTSALNTAGTMAGIVVLMVLVVLLNLLLDGGEARVLHWRPRGNRSATL